MRVSFATTNVSKIDGLDRVLQSCGIGVDVERLDLPEIQAETAAEVASAKVQEAFRRLRKPVVVNDLAFHLDGLGGWPGPHVKTALAQIGLGKVLAMLAVPEIGGGNFRCRMVTALAVLDGRLESPRVFLRELRGRLSPEAYATLPDRPGTWFSQAFVPDGEAMALGLMPESRHASWRRSPAVEAPYRELAAWLLARTPAD